MRVFNVQQSARPAYFDRNPTERSQQYTAGGVAPHANTARFSYTIPAGKKAWAEIVTAGYLRSAAAAPVAKYITEVNYTPSGGSASDLIYIQSLDNTLGALQRQQFATQKFMGAGGQVNGYTSDASTGGTVDYALGWFWVEFDA